MDVTVTIKTRPADPVKDRRLAELLLGPRPIPLCRNGLHRMTPDNVKERPNEPGVQNCRACHNASKRRHRVASPAEKEANRRRAARNAETARTVVFDHYGWSCVCCGEDHPKLLTLDHIDGDGAKERRSGNSNAGSMIKRAYAHYKRTGTWRTDLQTMCGGCNDAKGTGAVCPHRIPTEVTGQLSMW